MQFCWNKHSYFLGPRIFSLQKTCFSIIWQFKDFSKVTHSLSQSFWTTYLTTGLIVNKEREKDKGSRLVSGLGESKDRTWFAFWRRNITKPLFEIQSQNTWLFLNLERLANAASWVTSSSRPRKPFSVYPWPWGRFSQVKDNLLNCPRLYFNDTNAETGQPSLRYCINFRFVF